MRNLLIFIVVMVSVGNAFAYKNEIQCDVHVYSVIENDDRDPEYKKYPQVWDSRQWFSIYKGREKHANRLEPKDFSRIVVKEHIASIDGVELRRSFPVLAKNEDRDLAWAYWQGDYRDHSEGTYVKLISEKVNSSVFVTATAYQNGKPLMTGQVLFSKEDLKKHSRQTIFTDTLALADLKAQNPEAEDIELYQKLKLGDLSAMAIYCNVFGE